MNSETPLSPLPLHHLRAARVRVLTTHQLRELGVTAAETAEQCRPRGRWQQLLPGVHLLHAGPPTAEERLRAALLYARRRGPSVPRQGGGEPQPEAMITGRAALSLHGFGSVASPATLDRIDVLVARNRRLRSAGFAHVLRAAELPVPEQLGEIAVAPVPRALADAVGQLTEPVAVRQLLTEAVRGGHCEASAVLAELSRARLLARPQVADAVDGLLAEDRAQAERLLYAMVRDHGLPDPLWNVDLRLPGGPRLGAVDAFWPEYAVALELDARLPGAADAVDDTDPATEADGTDAAGRRAQAERLGLTVVRCAPRRLREAPEQQAVVVRTALMAAVGREPAAYVMALPR